METVFQRLKAIDSRYLIVCICALLFIIGGSLLCDYNATNADYEAVETATVVEVISTSVESWVEDMNNTTVIFTAKLTSGDSKGETVEMEQYIDSMYLPVDDAVEKGDTILALETSVNGGSETWSYAGVDRTGGIAKLCMVFFVMILLVGGLKGCATIVSLLFSVAAIFLVYVPAILSGWNVYFITIVIAAYVIFVSLLLLNGFNRKTLCAIVGNLSGTLVAGLMALSVNAALGITGVIDQDYVFLTMLEGDVSIDLKAVVWGGILIGSLGAIMDVSMSLASAMQEIAREMHDKTMPKLVYSGMQIGKDMIGTMTNTLILAYVGGSLAVVLLFTAYSKNTMVIMNMEMIVTEIIQAVVGSMGILVAVPLTVFFSAWKFMDEPACVDPDEDSDVAPPVPKPLPKQPKPQSKPKRQESQPKRQEPQPKRQEHQPKRQEHQPKRQEHQPKRQEPQPKRQEPDPFDEFKR
ncbi:YibE/F family protein [Bengtsoniella intestinalis]|uniref:YibE/F family protein n=1 Tax=Bengtsoniella intestinalis TaxID=3073143 RepID=UPI00391FBABF